MVSQLLEKDLIDLSKKQENHEARLMELPNVVGVGLETSSPTAGTPTSAPSRCW